jgi:DNA polymerase I
MVVHTALLIDVDYSVREGKTKVRLLMKGKKKMFRLYDDYEPYFYLDAPKSEKETIEKTSTNFRGSVAKVVRVEEHEIQFGAHKKKLLKIYAEHPFHVPALRDALKDYEAYEHRIPFGKRYMIDKGLAPFTLVTYERERQQIRKILKVRESGPVKLRMLAFDIETYNPHGAPRPELDPAIMVSYADEKSGVFTWKETGKKFAHKVNDEKEMLSAFCELVKNNDAEMILGYNSASFDLPYLKKRADVLGVKLPLGRDGSDFRKMQRGIRDVVKVTGRLHIDLYPVVRFLGAIGALKVSKFTLENAYEEITGKKKHMVKRLEIWQMWDSDEERKELAEYSLHDAEVTLEIGKIVLPLEIEMSRLTKTPLFDVCNSSTGQLVESLLMYRSFEHGMLIPNRPDEGEVKRREANPIQGAFVKLPSPGIYDNMVVFDFRGLYPSIIMAHNIDPYTLDCDCCKPDGHKSPTGARFCKKKKGLVPTVLGDLIGKRAELKDKLKGLSRDSEEYNVLFARQQALKILNNSFYGYLAYARSRWYSREAGESVTAWGRQYIQDTIAKAQETGFEVLYGDTDSIFLLMGEKKKEDAISFMKKINSELPETMELELEGFYPRGVFVTKKGNEKGAKKKYALIGEDGRIKIRGFELVRRDWSDAAKKTQRAVLSAILKDGSKEKAVSVVKEMVGRLKDGKVPLEELVIYTTIRKDPAKYELLSPEIAAARKAIKRGMKLGSGSMIGYVITKTGASISDKAEVVDFAKDYDANYYIEHQILPSVMKILKELGVSEDDLKFKGTQKGLGGFF